MAEKNKAGVEADGGGERYNEGKNLLEIIPPEWIWGLGMVLTRGSMKYAICNWERGMSWAICVGCALRHTVKFICGERYDKETGCHHMFMAAWNCCVLATYDIRGIGENDLVGELGWLAKVAMDPDPAWLAEVEAKKAEEAEALPRLSPDML